MKPVHYLCAVINQDAKAYSYAETKGRDGIKELISQEMTECFRLLELPDDKWTCRDIDFVISLVQADTQNDNLSRIGARSEADQFIINEDIQLFFEELVLFPKYHRLIQDWARVMEEESGEDDESKAIILAEQLRSDVETIRDILNTEVSNA